MSLILDFIFPKTCYGCGKTGYYFCPKCAKTLEIRSIQTRLQKPFEGSLSLFKYQSFIKNALTELKYGFITDLVPELSTLISNTFQKNFPNLLNYWLKNNFTVVPVPLHSFRQNWRGFNQSSLIAKSFSSNLSLNFNEEIIFRNRSTSPQAKIKNKLLRHHHLDHAFSLQKEHSIPQNIILFDDVSTTFSTLKSVANTFPQSKIWALTIAGSYF